MIAALLCSTVRFSPCMPSALSSASPDNSSLLGVTSNQVGDSDSRPAKARMLSAGSRALVSDLPGEIVEVKTILLFGVHAWEPLTEKSAAAYFKPLTEETFLIRNDLASA